MLEWLKKAITNRRGFSFPLMVAIALALAMILCVATEYLRLCVRRPRRGDRQLRECLPRRAGGVFRREYTPSGSSWSASVNMSDIYGRLDETLGLQNKDGAHVKKANGKEEFSLSGLSVTVRNAPLAPSDPKTSQSFTAVATVRLEVPVSFGGKALSPM